ncbi:MAG: sodium/proton-translocating pyrophosphatase [Saprospiraceae bacterium]
MVALSFILGAICSALAGFIKRKVATKANVRTILMPVQVWVKLVVAFAGGSVMGMGVVGLGVLGLGALFFGYSSMGWDVNKVITVITAFAHLLSHFSLV